MIQRAAWTVLATRRAVPANRPPDDRFTRQSRTWLPFARSGDVVAPPAAAADSDSSPSARREFSRQGHPAQPLRRETQASETASRG